MKDRKVIIQSSATYSKNSQERKSSSDQQDKNPGLLTQLRNDMRSRHYSRRTEETYSLWVKRYCHFHKLRRPAEMGESENNAFLTHLAVKEKVSALTQNQALSALLFLYRLEEMKQWKKDL